MACPVIRLVVYRLQLIFQTPYFRQLVMSGILAMVLLRSLPRFPIPLILTMQLEYILLCWLLLTQVLVIFVILLISILKWVIHKHGPILILKNWILVPLLSTSSTISL